MPNPRLATRYAKSLIDLAIEKGELEKTFANMEWLQQVVRQSKEFVNLLKSPVVKADKKEQVVDAIIGQNVNVIINSFVHLMIRKGRESYLPEVISAFILQYKQHKSIHTVILTTAFPLDDDLKERIIAQIRKTSDLQNIELETLVDKDLVGGFVLEAGDKLIDASIAYKLKKVAREFENNDFVYKLR